MSETFFEWRERWIKIVEAKGHRLRQRDGRVDEFAVDFDFHNGPCCELCGESWCMHCNHDPDKINDCQNVVNDA